MGISVWVGFDGGLIGAKLRLRGSIAISKQR